MRSSNVRCQICLSCNSLCVCVCVCVCVLSCFFPCVFLFIVVWDRLDDFVCKTIAFMQLNAVSHMPFAVPVGTRCCIEMLSKIAWTFFIHSNVDD